MHNSPFLSVIIPTYNVEKFVIPTLNSILAQTFNDYEIIIVDDESTDNTYMLCDEFKKQNIDRNIQLWKKKHGGVSKARNFGLSKALGKYIHFMDADDEIVPDMYQIFYKLCDGGTYDLVIGAVEVIRSNRAISLTTTKIVNCSNKTQIVHWLRDISVTDKDWMLNVVWNKWFKKGLITESEMEFKEICPGEDYEFVIRFIGICQSLYVCNTTVYKYFQRGTTSLLNQRYSHESQIVRRQVIWDTTEAVLASMGVFNPNFLIAEGYSLYSSLYSAMTNEKWNSTYLTDYLKMKQYDYIALYFNTKGTVLSHIAGRIFASRIILLLKVFFVLKKIFRV